MTGYLVPARAGEAEVEVKRSRFLAVVRRVADEGAARAVVEEMRRTHWDARHHCSAFVAPATTVSPPGQPAPRCWTCCAARA